MKNRGRVYTLYNIARTGKGAHAGGRQALPAPRLNSLRSISSIYLTGQAWRKTTRLRSGELRRGTPIFALASYAAAWKARGKHGE